MRQNISNLERPESLREPELETPNLAYSRKGFSVIRGGIILAAMPACGLLGTYVGEGLGWLLGNAVEFLPFVKNLAPWCAERTGLMQSTSETHSNIDLYQTAGSIAGFWAGPLAPIRAALYFD